MSKTIKINPQRMSEIGDKFIKSSEQNKTLAGDLKGLIEGLVAEWQGASQERFHSSYSDAHKQLEKVSVLLKDVGDELKAIADRFRAADENP